ncbi:multiple inositol polyphosphate phosphatase 1 isoform X2 [Belonocnema kinseyi]|uniref:multiple inositol polyphosphate phosphatase 1 isoform X2 n=1 Tax=Belonocnema kinseyi TaxID=2817044 RepID=UPI00143CFA91|nr:multiple inositol polyphosphate phosphatase 1 isoform X2 [Belonocnema kinseyi]
MYAITVFLAFLAYHVTARESDYCLANDNEPYLYFGTKSAYNFMHGNLKPELTCKPIQIFVISRHGTRYPGSKVIPKMKTLLNLRQQIVFNHEERKMGHLCEEDLQNFKFWQLDEHVREDMADFLSPQGEADLKELALRLREGFPSLLKPNDTSRMNSNYLFESTKTQRTEASMEAFIEGLFGSKNAVTPKTAPQNDTLLHANKNCPTWEEATNNEGYYTEVKKFNEGPEMQNVLVNVSRRLGFTENLTLDTVNIMYDMCRFEKAWRIEKVSTWCAAFSKNELRTLEYREDLNYYYYTGPGRDINAKLGCPPMKNMFEHFRKLEGDNYSEEPKGIFYFSHTVTLQTLATLLGIYDNHEKLLASNFKYMAKRQWRTTFVGPFATNFIAVFYKCNDTRSSNIHNKVLLHWAERIVQYEGCNVGLCDWEFLKQKLGKKADECNMDFCYNSGPSIKSNFSDNQL